MLKRLLSSIPNNEMIEVIVVDDKSDLKAENFLELKRNENNRNVYFLENTTPKKGAGVCRNIGLEIARGDWLLFADADDFFLEGFYSSIRKYLWSNNDVIFFTPTSMEVESGELSDRHIKYKTIINQYIENRSRESELLLRYEFPVPWSKLINSKFLKKKKIYFDEVMASNDTMFSAKVGFHMEKFEVSYEEIYCVTKTKGSLINNVSENVFQDRLKVRIEYIQFLKKQLSKKEQKVINLSGRGMIYNSIIYKLGFKNTIFTYFTLKKNKIEIFNYQFLNPVFSYTKIRKNFSAFKKKKKFLKQ